MPTMPDNGQKGTVNHLTPYLWWRIEAMEDTLLNLIAGTASLAIVIGICVTIIFWQDE